MSENMTDIAVKPRRRLTDLYVRGEFVDLDDGSDQPVRVWVQKMMLADEQEALSRSNSERAKVLALRNASSANGDRQLYEAQAEFEGLLESREIMVDYLIAPDLIQRQVALEAELANEDEWSKDDYLEGLRTAWFDDGLKDVYAVTPEDEKAKATFEALRKFTDQLTEKLEVERTILSSQQDFFSDEELYSKVIDKYISAESESAWLTEFRKRQIFYCVRDSENTSEKYFYDRAEIDQLDGRVVQKLLEAIDNINVDVVEGKG